MTRHIHVEEDRQLSRALKAAQDADEAIAPTGAVLDGQGRPSRPARGGVPAMLRAIDGLQASAGNDAVSRLIGGSVASRHRAGRPQVHAAHAPVEDRPAVQRDDDDASASDGGWAGGDTSGEAAVVAGDEGPMELGAGAPTPGASWTKVGPPSNTTYTVSGSLRSAANAVAARTEAGSVTTTPTDDTDTWTPDGGTEKVIAARVTVDQVMELPTWSDKSSATRNQQAEWDRFAAAVKVHEDGHVAKDKTAFASVHSKMVGKSPSDADAAYNAADAKAKTDNAAYDTSTQHGITQGTGINPNIDEVTKVP